MTEAVPPALQQPSWASDALSVCGFTGAGGAGPAAVTCVHQVHGDAVHVVATWEPPDEGDGLWTNRPGLPVAVRVADCVPLLLWDPEAQAVAAVHAGWRGTALSIGVRAVEAGAALGVRPERLRVAIGPCISGARFEVGPDVVAGLKAAGLGEADLALRTGPRGRPHVDLRRANRVLLTRAGVLDVHIEDVGGCTFDDRRYDSWRRDGPRAGRMRGIIGLAPLLLLMACAPSDRTVSRRADAAMALVATDPAAAADALADLSAARPDDAWLHAALGRALHAAGDHAGAAAASARAVDLAPDWADARWNLACHRAAAGLSDGAITALARALELGDFSPDDVATDPDLAVLAEDHRMVVYRETGILQTGAEDARLVVLPPEPRVGDAVSLMLVLVSMNRPLMGERSPLQLIPLGLPDPAAVQPIRRSERFHADTDSGHEVHYRSVHWSFRVLRPGPLVLGPFEVHDGGPPRRTGGAVVVVEPREAAGDDAPRSTSTRAELAAFFDAPSHGDAALLSEAHPDPASPAPWRDGPDGAWRAWSFRAERDQLPPLPPTEGEIRSSFVRRATEGPSHVVDRR